MRAARRTVGDFLLIKMATKENKRNIPYKILARIVKIFHKKSEFVGLENLTDEPTLIITNHAQVHGPLTSELYFPLKKKIWCIGQMMHLKEIPAYAYQDFWSLKPKSVRWIYKICSYLIAPIAAFVFNHADTIGVYKDARLLSTFRETMKALEKGEYIIITPERTELFNEIVNDFQDKFVDVAKLYYKKCGKRVQFVPVYMTKEKTVVHEPIEFTGENDAETLKKIVDGIYKA